MFRLQQQIQLVVRVGLELGAPELQVQHSNCLATLPPVCAHNLRKDKGANYCETCIGKTKHKA